MARQGSKVDTNGTKLHQTTLKPLKKRSFRLLTPRNGDFRHSRNIYTLLEPSGDLLQHLSTLRGPLLFQKSHSFTLWEAPKGPWKGQKRPCRPFLAYSRPKRVKIGQNGSKRYPNGSKYSQNGPKWWQHRLKRRQRGQNTVQVGSQGS